MLVPLPMKRCVVLLFICAEPSAFAARQGSLDKPKLWESTTQIVANTLYDKSYKHWSDDSGPPKTDQLCLMPYRPKVGKSVKLGNCHYTRVNDRNGRISRKRVCTNEFGVSWITHIKGLETDRHYEFRLETQMKRKNGKLISETVMLESGRLLGECPAGMEVHDAVAE